MIEQPSLLNLLPSNPEEVSDDLLRAAWAYEDVTNLYHFGRNTLGFDKLRPKPHADLCDFLTNSGKYEGRLANKWKLILLPRGTYKTTVACQAYPLWLLLRDPNLRILLDGETYAKSAITLRGIKGLVTTNQMLRDLHGSLNDPISPEAIAFAKKNRGLPWNEDEIIVGTRTAFATKEGSISVAGVDIVRVGMHYDVVIGDDYHSEKNVTTREQIEKVTQHIQLMTAILDPGATYIIIGTRWDDKDAYGWIIDEVEGLAIREPGIYKGKTFDIMIYPWKMPNGALFAPEIINDEVMAKIRTVMTPYQISCQYPACFGSRVLDESWNVKNIEDVRPGDTLISFDEFPLGHGQHRKLRLATVKRVVFQRQPVVRVCTAAGKTLRCGKYHPWLLVRDGYTGSKYGAAQPNWALQRVLDLDDACSSTSGWLAGIFDGEGSSDFQTIRIAQSRNKNPLVRSAIECELRRLHLPYGGDDMTVWLRGGIQERWKFLQATHPVRAERITRTFLNASIARGTRDRIVSVTDDGEELVVCVETDSKTLLIEGYCSHNCNDPIDNETAIFKYDWIKDNVLRGKDVADLVDRMIVFTGVDPAIGEGQEHDYSAIVTMGYVSSVDDEGEWNTKRILLDAHYGHWNPDKLVDEVIEVARKWKPLKIRFEGVSGFKAYESIFNERMRQLRRRIPIVFEPADNSKAKTVKIGALAPMFQYGNFYTVKGARGSDEFIEEYRRFPRAKHDDILDALADIEKFAYFPNERFNTIEEEYRALDEITGY